MSAENDPDALYRQAVAEYGTALERLAWSYEADPDRRLDLLQDIHLQVWRSFTRFDSRCSLRTWVYRVAHNVAASHVVRQMNRRTSIPPMLTLEEAEARAATDDPEAAADRRLALERLLSLIQRLEVVDRQVILAYLEDFDAETIAEITGLTTAAVWTKIHRIKNLLTRQFRTGERNAR
jgi:RNA polymerase sigma-70 factor (ECF subfamily)